MIWPRSAILHRAAASSVEGMAAVTVSTADKMRHFGLINAHHAGKVDGVLHDIDLV